jgi:signal transduction histidine kinase
MPTAPPEPPPPARPSVWRYARVLAPAVLLWAALVGWLAYLLQARSRWSQEADEAVIREWIDESRVFRKTLPDLVREYLALIDAGEVAAVKSEEIAQQIREMTAPTRMYQTYLPAFPEVYRVEVRVDAAVGGRPVAPIVWDSPVPRPRQQNRVGARVLDYPNLGGDPRASLRVEYRLHAFNKLQRDEEEGRKQSLVVAAVLLSAGVLAVWGTSRFLRREREREFAQLTAQAALEHAQRTALELDRKLLEQSLEAARQEGRAATAERATLEMKSQLYASIGIMAGSYAHNIKNLLVRPNDLLARCLEADGLSHDQEGMLHEVRSTLGTVTERLQQILRTVRRDPSRSEMTRLDLNQLVHEVERTWTDIAREKWKLRVEVHPAPEPLPVQGDLSHLQQAVENLLFNARDATFEMRNHLRDAARRGPHTDAAARKQALIDAASWKGEVVLTASRQGGVAVLEVRDNGVGMSEEVRQNCLRTHFSTKRDNALYEGYNAGMGLGLSFVAVVLEHHGARLAIESEPLRGATFRVEFPLAVEARAAAGEPASGVGLG